MSGGDSFQADRYTGHREEQKRSPPVPRRGRKAVFVKEISARLSPEKHIRKDGGSPALHGLPPASREEI